MPVSILTRSRPSTLSQDRAGCGFRSTHASPYGGRPFIRRSTEPLLVDIVQTLSRARAGKVIQPPKTRAGRRIIDLDTRTIAVLRTHQGRQLLEKMQAEGAYKDAGFVFANAVGDSLDPKWPLRSFQALAKQCGVKSVKLHSLRHFHASVLFAADQNVFEVSRRLGHASITTTADIYGNMLPGQGRKQADAFAAMMEEKLR